MYGIVFGCRQRGLGPVSYTHLHNLSFRRDVFINLYDFTVLYQNIGQLVQSTARIDNPASLNPVSYTHLDVYKRQDL